MVVLCNRADHYIFARSFFLSSSSIYFSSPILSHRRLDVYHTSTHGVASVRIYDAGLKRAARGSLEMQVPKNCHRTTLSGYISTTKAYIDNRKKLLSSNISSTSSQYGELCPTSGWDRFVSLGHPCKFQRVSRLGSLTARHLVVVVSQTLRRWTEGATYVRQGDHHVGHWPTF